MFIISRYKVLQIGSGTEYGGGTTYVLILMEAIRRHGGEVHFACTPGLTLDAVRASGYPVFPVPALQREIRPWADLQALAQLVRVIRSGCYDLVHTHTSKGGFLGRLAAKISGVPVIFHTVHGFAFHEENSWKARMLYVTLEKIAARFCDRMIIVNHEDRLKAIDYGVAGPDKVVTIYNGIDTAPFNRVYDRIKVRRELGVREGEHLVGMVARLAPSKAPLDFVNAADYVLARKPNVRFIMVGDGPLRDEINQVIQQLGWNDRIILTGHRTDVPEILAAMDVFVLTTLWEGLPIALLEAMAVSLPVVATNVRGPREVVQDGETGYLAPPKEPIAIGELILKLLEEDERAREMGRKGRRLIDEVFNATAMTEKTLAVYEEQLRTKNVYREAGQG